jgi:nucleoside phosphorylase
MIESDMEELRAAMKGVWNQRKSRVLRRKFDNDTRAFPDVKYGLLVSGSSVIAHDVKRDEIITRFTNAIALEMEMYGAYTAVDRTMGAKPLVLGIKGVADFGDGAKHREFQSLAGRLSYCVASAILKRIFE